MTATIVLPNDWAVVPLAVAGSYIAMISLGGKVMAARQRFGVSYPAMYASVVKDNEGKIMTDANSESCAEQFNCVQRGHQNGLENHYAILVLTLLPSVLFPKLSALALTLWTFGAVTYGNQYSSGGVKGRNKNLALTKYVGALMLLGLNLALSYSVYTA